MLSIPRPASSIAHVSASGIGLTDGLVMVRTPASLNETLVYSPTPIIPSWFRSTPNGVLVAWARLEVEEVVRNQKFCSVPSTWVVSTVVFASHYRLLGRSPLIAPKKVSRGVSRLSNACAVCVGSMRAAAVIRIDVFLACWQSLLRSNFSWLGQLST